MKQQKLKHILLRAALFLLILFALDRSIGLVLLTLAGNVKNTGIMGTVNKTMRSDADVFVLGSSRAVHHFDCDVIGKALGKKVYNAGRNGSGLAYSRFVVDLIDGKLNPELFIIQLEPQNLMNGCYSEQILAIADTAPYLSRSKKTRERLFSKSKWLTLKYLSHAFRFNGQVLFFISDITKKDPFVNGYIPLHKSTSHAVLDQKQYIRNRGYATNQSQQALDDLTEMIKIIQSRGAKVVIVSAPRWRKTHEMPELYYEIAKSIEKIALEENVQYIKILQETHPVFNDPSLFADSSHLNYKGAAVFSKIVVEKFISKQSEISEDN